MAWTERRYVEEFGKYLGVWRSPPPARHAGGGWTNRFVEAAKVSAYASGHLNCWAASIIGVAGVWYIAKGVVWLSRVLW